MPTPSQTTAPDRPTASTVEDNRTLPTIQPALEIWHSFKRADWQAALATNRRCFSACGQLIALTGFPAEGCDTDIAAAMGVRWINCPDCTTAIAAKAGSGVER